MGTLGKIKRKLANLIAKRPLFHRRVIDAVLSNDEATDALAAKLLTRKSTVGRMLQSPGFFELVLTRLSNNPEAFFLMLSRKEVSQKLSAQLAVLASLAAEPKTLAAFLAAIPAELIPDVVAHILTSEEGKSRVNEQLASDKESIVQLLVLSAALLKDESRPSARLRVLMEDLAKEPVFRLALHQDAEFRALLLEIAESGYASVGEAPVKTRTASESTA
jgi:hypothetical protein